MEKFTRTLHGYNPEEVNEFLDDTIKKLEKIIDSNTQKNEEIKRLKEALLNNTQDPEIIEKAKKYDELCLILNNAIKLAQDTGERIRMLAKRERNLIIEEAKKDAETLVKDASKKSEEIEYQAKMIRKNIIVFKRKLRRSLEEQIKLVEEIEVLE